MLLICFGTRPEYIKILSLIKNLNKNYFKLCFIGQHTDLISHVNVDFKINIIDGYSENRLNNIMINILKYSDLFNNIKYVLVQGDTTTAFAIAISAFHYNIKIIHLEAGLRTFDIKDPYPEEFNRQTISKLASIHFCPTENNKKNLLKEGINDKDIFVVGNTVLDNIIKDHIEYKNKILITLHRRNNIDKISEWFVSLEKLADKYKDIEFVLPMHPNPDIQKHKKILKNVKVIEPLSHSKLIDIIKICKFIITDSGGIQEEASFLGKRFIICRKATERQEILETGHGILCPTPNELENSFSIINNNYKINSNSPFGDGFSYKKIIEIINPLLI